MKVTQQAQRVVLLTGAARGIGEAMAHLFSERGCAVAALDVLESGRAVCDQIASAGGACQFYHCDITDEAQVKATVDTVFSHYGRIDILLNNAGVVLVKPLVETQWDEF